MTERPIIFSGEMVRAILDGRKCQTRRVIKPDFANYMEFDGKTYWYEDKYGEHHNALDYSPYGQPGDTLWVRETWMPETEDGILTGGTIWKATDKPEQDGDTPLRWSPSIHMPRWAARILLDVVDVRVERVQDITIEGARAEGIPETWGDVVGLWGENALQERAMHMWDNATSVENFAWLWDKINGKRGFGWTANPWVWKITFKKGDGA